MIFLGCIFEKKYEKDLLKNSKCGLPNAGNTFQWNIIDGLNDNLNDPVDIYNILPVGVYPKEYKKIFLKSKKWSCHNSNNLEIGCINIPIVKQWQRYRTCKKMITACSDRNIIIYSPYLPFLKAVYQLPSDRQITLIVTDLPEYYDLGKSSSLKKIARRFINQRVYRYMNRIDKFVLLTEQMKDVLQVGKRPFVVIEGMCGNEHNTLPRETTGHKKIILYSGTLHYQFGIKNLLDAFHMIDQPNYELWICGCGDAEKEIRYLSNVDKRIRYFGFVPKKEVRRMQEKATVLINPRMNKGEYVKYSFPSKTIEYMASGTPVIMYKLDGVPQEYDNYVYYIKGDSDIDLKNGILTVCEKSQKELELFGLKAREFVLTEKNRTVQTKKIINLLEEE